jgi:tripartite-type tricarboxylate transporter receptor subunit TctC
LNLGVLVNCSTSISSKYGTLTDIVDAARKSPGKLNFGAISPGSTQNLSAHLFKQLTGIDVTIVPFRTTPDLVTALLRNDVDVGFDYYAGLQSVINDKKVRVTAVSGEKRIALLANVPTAEESGFPDFVVVGWNALTAPAGLIPRLRRPCRPAWDRRVASRAVPATARFSQGSPVAAPRSPAAPASICVAIAESYRHRARRPCYDPCQVAIV